MSNETQNLNEVDAGAVIDNLTAQIAGQARQLAIDSAKNARLVEIVERSQEIIRELNDRVEELTAAVKPKQSRARKSEPEEVEQVIEGEISDM